MTDTGKPTNSRNRYYERLLAGIVRYEPHDRQAVLAFRAKMYGPASVYADEAYLRWLYEEPVSSPAKPTEFWLYRKDGQIEAHQGSIRVALKIGLRLYDAQWSVELMVDPRWRGTGVGAVLSEVAHQECRLSLGLDVSDAARKAFLSAGWVDTGTVPLYVRPLDTPALLNNRSQPQMARLLGQPGNIVLRAIESVGWMGAALAGLRMEKVTQFDDRADQIWRAASSAYPVICRRDSHYLNWRFARFPDPERYRLFYFSHRSRPVGYAVLRNGEHRGLFAGYLVDFLCAPQWTYGLLAYCLRFFRRQKVKVVYCLHQNPVASGAFALLGFARRSSGWPLMVRADNLPVDALALVRDQRNWFITAGDSNADRSTEGIVFASDRPLETRSASSEPNG